MRIHKNGRHISGAEDLVAPENFESAISRLASRMLSYPNENPPLQQILTIDPISPSSIHQGALLPVRALESSSLRESMDSVRMILENLLPPSLATRVLMIFEKEILGCHPRNGALLVNEQGHIINESANGGIRTTHFGCLPTLRKSLEEAAARRLVQPSYRFVDALILSSKVLMAEQILLELCASDDPNYQTGYIASRTTGYIRIPFIKPAELPSGGRLYLLKEENALDNLLTFLRETPVLFSCQQPHSPLPFKLSSLQDINLTAS
ncbi:MAG: 6-carboxyhexanoate--CoA ligase [Leptospirillia bacterium]